MDSMHVYEKNLNKTTYQRIKHVVVSALVIYGISSILARIITYVFIAPVVIVVVLLGTLFTKLFSVIIPPSKEEKALKNHKNREAKKVKRELLQMNKEYHTMYENWERQKLLTNSRGK